MTLIRRGAEAELHLERWCDRNVIIKRRTQKRYRHPELDSRLRAERTVHESQLMHLAKLAGVPTPLIYSVDPVEATIIMEYVGDKRVKEIIEEAISDDLEALCKRIGETVGLLHMTGIVHGDLTTSNMILDREDGLFLIDFGLAKRTDELEERGIDLHLLRRVFTSTHHRQAERCFKWILEGYSGVIGGKICEDVKERMRAIAERGRYTGGEVTLSS